MSEMSVEFFTKVRNKETKVLHANGMGMARGAITEAYGKYQYVLDPHGAVGYLGLKAYQAQNHDAHGIFFETAHPAKFRETVEEVLEISVEIPERLAGYAKRKKVSVKISHSFGNLKHFLLSF